MQEWEFFDCVNDPMELFNVWDGPSPSGELVVARERMLRLLEEKMEHIGDTPRHPVGLSAERLIELYPTHAGVASVVKTSQTNMH